MVRVTVISHGYVLVGFRIAGGKVRARPLNETAVAFVLYYASAQSVSDSKVSCVLANRALHNLFMLLLLVMCICSVSLKY